MKKIILICLLIAAGLIFYSQKAFAKDVDVKINEIFWSGSYVSSSDEFIELKNNTDKNIDIAGWQITGINSNGAELLILTISEGVIPAGGNYLISNSKKDYLYSNGESIVNIDPDFVDSKLTLGNEHLQIKIYDGKWDDGRYPIDIAGDGDLPLAGNNTIKSSMERNEPPLDGQKENNWSDCKESKNLDAGSQELATPENSGKPKINSVSANSSESFASGSQNNLSIEAEVSDNNGLSDISSVIADLSEFGGDKNTGLYDNGLNGDLLLGDGVYTLKYLLTNIHAGVKNIKITAADSKQLFDTKTINLNFYELSEDVLINEILPKPGNSGHEEFIELYNKSDHDINLFGWKLDDIPNGGSKEYVFDEIIIPSHGYLALIKQSTSIILNDSGDTVNLIDPKGTIIDTIQYKSAHSGQSYNRINNDWEWSITITPNCENIINSTYTNSGAILSIKESKNYLDTQVTVEGYVNSVPGQFSNQYFYIEDDTAGIQIYEYYKRFPNMGIGDRIRVTGEISKSSNGYRIKIDGAESILIINNNNEITPKEIKSGDLLQALEGMLVHVHGYVIDTSGSTFYIDDNTGAIKIYIISYTNIDKPRMKKGLWVEITGVVSCSRNVYRILPRMQSDVTVEKTESSNKSGLNIIKKAYAAEGGYVQNYSSSNNKASEIDNSNINKSGLLIKAAEIAIILSIILLIILIGEKYAGKKDNYLK